MVTRTRTDRRGRTLKTFLVAEIVGTDITVEQLRQAIGVKRSRWYGDGTSGGRAEAPDFPDPNELLHLAKHYQLGEDGWLNLLVEFGWLDPRPDAPGYTAQAHPSGPFKAIRKGGADWHHRGPAV
jgi:hypothetical protein